MSLTFSSPLRRRARYGGRIHGVGKEGEAYVVAGTLLDVRNLERVPGTAVLRMLRRPRSAAEAEAQRRALLGDPAVLPSTKQRIEEAIMEQRIRTDKHETETWAQYYRRLERRETLLRTAQLAADEAALRELEAISDVDELERTVHAFLAARLRHGDGQ